MAVRAAGVNALEWKIRQGLLRDVVPLELPAGIGGDAAGVVDEVGDDVPDVEPGDAVFGSGRETYAEYAVLTSWARIPAGVSFAEAAGYATPLETAIRVLDELGIGRGATLLVSGAAGGVGSALVQVAVQRGIAVVGTASEANHAYLAGLGARPTTYGEGMVARVRALAPRIDAAVDVAGSGVIGELVELTGDPAAVISVADFTAPRFGARVSTAFGADKSPALRAGAELAAAGGFRLPVQETFTLDEAGRAQAVSAAGHVRGRLAVTLD